MIFFKISIINNLTIYIGENDESRQMSQELETESIKEEINKIVALKLSENSPNAKLFHQIYPIKQSPAIYLISHQGALLDVFSDKLNKEVFIKKLTEFTKNENAKSSLSASSADQSTATSTSESVTKEKSREEKKKEQMQKIEELRAGLKEKQEKEEEERSKNQEMERIKSGKAIQKLRKEREEQEALNAIKEKEKDAIFDKQERERVLRGNTN